MLQHAAAAAKPPRDEVRKGRRPSAIALFTIAHARAYAQHSHPPFMCCRRSVRALGDAWCTSLRRGLSQAWARVFQVRATVYTLAQHVLES